MTAAEHASERVRERLAAVNPLAVLGRGYALVYDREEHLLTRAAEAAGQKEMTDGNGSFEEKLQEVQEIIARIEDGKLPLEDSVKQFEEGMKTLSALDEELKEMNRRLTVLQNGKEQEMAGTGEDNEDV